MKKCETCKFFHILTLDDNSFNECRFNPPSVLVDKQRWPLVTINDWCGRYEVCDEVLEDMEICEKCDNVAEGLYKKLLKTLRT